jgi:acyl dehydratase
MMRVADINVPTNPLFTNREYAKKSKYGNPIAWPLISSLEVMPAMPKSKGIGDYMVVSAHNDTKSYYKPFYEGDTLYSITVEQHCTDIIPAEGS